MQSDRSQCHAYRRSSPGCSAFALLMLSLVGFAPSIVIAAGPSSDLNRDGVVDIEDLKIFAKKYLEVNWETYDWCAWIEEGGRLQDKYDHLVDFIRTYYECDAPPPPPPPPPPEDPLAVRHENVYPSRIALGPAGEIYVSDPKIGSVFIYELVTDGGGQTTLNMFGEFKQLGRVVGLAVDSTGAIFSGNTQHRRVEKYNISGEQLAIIGEGTVRMPTDLTFDADDNLYVADSDSGVVWVYRPDGSLLRTIRKGGLKKPMGVEVAYVDDGAGGTVGEVYVADKTDYKVKVFSLDGSALRSFGGFVQKEGWFNPTWVWQGMFVSVQSVAVDRLGRVHALDSYMNNVQIMDSNNTASPYLSHYGEKGAGPGQLLMPLDIAITPAGHVVVANTDNKRVDVIYSVPNQ